jgi:hypothetical protein
VISAAIGATANQRYSFNNRLETATAKHPVSYVDREQKNRSGGLTGKEGDAGELEIHISE